MTVTVLKEGMDIKSVFLGHITPSMEKDVENLNNNSLLAENYTLEEKKTDKSFYDIIEFLGLNKW